MSNNLLPAFACITVIGFSAALLPRLAAPSDSYISEALEPMEELQEPFYFVVNPESVTVTFGEPIFLTALTNFNDCVYTWEVSPPSYNSSDHSWSISGINSYADNFSGGSYVGFTSSRPNRSFYRCKAVRGESVVYSAPCIVETLPNSNLKSDYKYDDSQIEFLDTDFDEFYKSFNDNMDSNLEFEESEKTEVFEENERSVDNAE